MLVGIDDDANDLELAIGVELVIDVSGRRVVAMVVVQGQGCVC